MAQFAMEHLSSLKAHTESYITPILKQIELLLLKFSMGLKVRFSEGPGQILEYLKEIQIKIIFIFSVFRKKIS